MSLTVPRSAPVIPPPPPRVGKRRQRDLRWLIWPLSFTAGAMLGIVAYHFIDPVQSGFDYWLALLLG